MCTKSDEVIVELMIAGIDPAVWSVHFGELGPWEATCGDCADRRQGLCQGGRDPVECMRDDRHQVDISGL